MACFDHVKFIVDTDQYAGNFEREMAAYISGLYMYVGREQAEIAQRELTEEQVIWFQENLQKAFTEKGAKEYGNIHPSPSGAYTYNSVAFKFDEAPPVEMVELMKARAEGYTRCQYDSLSEDWKARGARKINILGFRTVRVTVTELEI